MPCLQRQYITDHTDQCYSTVVPVYTVSLVIHVLVGIDFRCVTYNLSSGIAQHTPRPAVAFGLHRRSAPLAVYTMLGLTFNLVDQLVFYGSYHSNPWNKGKAWGLQQACPTAGAHA